MDFNDILSFIPKDINPKTSAKIYFAGNAEEFNLHFDTITNQALHLAEKNSTTCTIWFRKHFDSLSPEENQLLLDFLSQAHLIIVPVTRSLLLDKCGVLQNEILFAKQNGKPILPIMLEDGLVELYSRSENFGDRQFLNPFDKDVTAIPYEKKLQDYLSIVLVDDKLRKEIQREFDAYVFLSYRKKDRTEAQRLMRQIHQNDFCRDIAIWYDEYLIPGEDFNDAIKNALQKSQLFALLVTPSIIEPDNYIIEHEYPMAQEHSKKRQTPILPIECVKTDKETLNAIYDELPPCTDADNHQLLSEALKASLKNVALMKNQDDPRHNYLIGLAYLNGIDVQIDYQRAISIITDAANCDFLLAKRKLIEIYKKGIGTPIDYNTALFWTDEFIGQCKRLFESDTAYGELLALANEDKYSLLTVMGQGTKGEEALKEAINYSKYLPMPQSVASCISCYMALASVHQKLKAAEFPPTKQLLHLSEINLAGIPALQKAEELAMQSQDALELAGLINYLLVGIYSLYFSINDKEKAAEYRTKIKEFCNARYPKGLESFDKYYQMDLLYQSINWENLDGVEEYLDLYFKNIESDGISKHLLSGLIRFAFDLSDVIAFLERMTPNKAISRFEKYIGKFISMFESVPLNEAGSDILSIRTRLYTVAADFEKAKGNYPTVFSLMNNSRLLAKEMLARNKNDSNRTLYLNLSLEAAKAALDLNNTDAGFHITNEAYKEWKSNCKSNAGEDSLIIEAGIYRSFADCFKKKNSHEDAVAFYEAAATAAAKLCNISLSAKNICCLQAIYNDFAWYKYQIGDLQAAISLFNSCLESRQIFVDYLKKNKEACTLTPSEDQKLFYHYCVCIRGLAGSYSTAKQYEKEEMYLRILLEIRQNEWDELWINDHYNLGICLYCQKRFEEAAPFFEEFAKLAAPHLTSKNRYQYAFSLLQAAAFNQSMATEYTSCAIENLLILHNENPNDQQVASLLTKLLGKNFTEQEEEK